MREQDLRRRPLPAEPNPALHHPRIRHRHDSRSTANPVRSKWMSERPSGTVVMVASNEEHPVGSALGVCYRNGKSAPAATERVPGRRKQNLASAPSTPSAAHQSRTVYASRNRQTDWTKSPARDRLRGQTGYHPRLVSETDSAEVRWLDVPPVSMFWCCRTRGF